MVAAVMAVAQKTAEKALSQADETEMERAPSQLNEIEMKRTRRALIKPGFGHKED